MSASGFQRVRRSRAEWQRLLERFAVSGLTQSAFCAREGVGLSTFARWRDRLAKEPTASEADANGPAPVFAEIDFDAPGETISHGAGSGWDVELDLGGGCVLRIRRHS